MALHAIQATKAGRGRVDIVWAGVVHGVIGVATRGWVGGGQQRTLDQPAVGA